MLVLFLIKQDIAQEAVKKRRRATKKPYSRAIVGATLEVIQKKRSEKPEVRDAAREAALRYDCFLFFFGPANWVIFENGLWSKLIIFGCGLLRL